MLTRDDTSLYNTRKSLRSIAQIRAYTEEQVRAVIGNHNLLNQKEKTVIAIE